MIKPPKQMVGNAHPEFHYRSNRWLR